MHFTIGFSKRDLAFSRFLRWTERRPYSHCYVGFTHSQTGQGLVLHAAEFNIHTLSIENFKKHGNTTVKEYHFEIKDCERIKNTLTFIFNQSGKPYGWVQLFGMAWVKICAFFGKKAKNPLADGDRTMVCSEFCAHFLSISGVLPDLDTGYAEIGGPSWVDYQLHEAGYREEN